MFSLEELEAIIAERAASGAPDSWTARLHAAGIGKAAKKLGEEGVEAALAAATGDRKGLIGESADLLYHLLVVLSIARIPLSEVLAELQSRTARSGTAEKAGRKDGAPR